MVQRLSTAWEQCQATCMRGPCAASQIASMSVTSHDTWAKGGWGLVCAQVRRVRFAAGNDAS